MMSPTQVETEELYPLNAFGSAMAPLFINLTLWIGVFMLMVILRIEVDDEGVKNLTIAQRFFGRGLLLAIIVVLQAIVCCEGAWSSASKPSTCPRSSRPPCCARWSTWRYSTRCPRRSSTSARRSASFSCSFRFRCHRALPHRDDAELLSVRLPALPVHVRNQRHSRDDRPGFYDGAWLSYVGVLIAFMIAFVIIGVLLRPYVTNLNRLFARQIEQSDIVNGEPVQLPARRFRVAQLIRVLSDRDEYREVIDARVERFMRLYPRFKWGALVLGIVVPVVATVVFAITETEKVVMLTGWLVWLVIIIAFLVIVEAVRDSLSRQVCLESMSDEEVRALYATRNVVAKGDVVAFNRVAFKTDAPAGAGRPASCDRRDPFVDHAGDAQPGAPSPVSAL